MPEALRQELHQIRQKLAAGGALSEAEMLGLFDRFERLLSELADRQAEERRSLMWMAGEQGRLDERLLPVENSRLFRALRAVGEPLRRWRLRRGLRGGPDPAYARWVALEAGATPPPAWFAERIRQFPARPQFSLRLAGAAARPEWLEATLESLVSQSYPNWELLVEAEPVPARFAGEARIRSADEPPRGAYVGWLAAGAVLAPHALFYVAQVLQHRQPELIYTDQDRLDAAGARTDPVFKPAWSPELLRSGAYPGRLLMISQAALEARGETPRSPAADQELVRALAGGGPHVVHIPRVLYHGREASPGPVAPPFTEPAQRPLASLIICSARRALLEHCLGAVDRATTYENREVVVVQHEAGAPWRLRQAGAVVPFAGPFNFALMNNLGARAARGQVLVFLNDDVEPLDGGWLSALMAQLERGPTGVVGARLLYPSGALQHAGVAVGIGDGAGHPGRGAFGSRYWKWLETPRNLSAVTGACLTTRREVFEQLGGFDLQFPVNYNDVDYCLRARAAGWEVVYEPAARLRHHECQSRPPGTRHWERQRLFARWAGLLLTGDPYYSPNLTTAREDASLALEEALDPARFPEGR